MRKDLPLPSEFNYGRATGHMVLLSNASRNARVVARKVSELTDALQLEWSIPADADRWAAVHDNGNAYLQASLGDTSHLFTVKSIIDGENSAKKLEQALKGHKPTITIVSGPCLFSAEGVKAIGQSGQQYSLTRRGEEITEPINQIAVDNHLSLYEIEAISRLGSFIHDLANSNDHVASVALNIPESEYYLYALDGYKNGFISQHQMLSWFDNVEKRRQRQIRLLSKKIGQGNNAHIYELSPLLGIKEYLREQIRQGNMPHFEDAKNILSQQDSLWRDIFAVSEINKWQDITDLSYVYAELSAAQQKGDTPSFAVAIENPTESKILGQAKAVAAQLTQYSFHLAGLYPHELWVVNDDSESDESIRAYNANKTMYHLKEDPHTKSRLARQMVSRYRRRG